MVIDGSSGVAIGCKAGVCDGWRLRGQAAYDTALAKEARKEELAAIPRCSLLAA